jgi:CheY-like chemotaxis protein
MRILVADDDKIARRVLGTFLQQSKHEVEIVENGLDALRIMLSADAPLLAIFDWVMPDVSGPELCRRIRAQELAVQPYIIILSSKKEKAEIAHALDAGANDFLTKPFNIVETQARLRAAERTIERQLALHRRIEELDAALQRHVELFEPEALAPAGEAPIDHLAGLAPLAPDRIEPRLTELLQREISSTAAPDAPPPDDLPVPPGIVMSWAGALLPREGLWIDLLIETAADNVPALFAQARGLPPDSPKELGDFCLTLQAAVCDLLFSLLHEARIGHVTPFDPVMPAGATMPALHALARRTGRSHPYVIAGLRLAVTLLVSPSPLVAKRSEQLRLLDILGQPYPPPESNEILILPEGVALNERLIERLGVFADGRVEAPPIYVHRPSSLAMHYNRNLRRI